MTDYSDRLTVEHLHVMHVSDWSVIFTAEVDAVDHESAIVEVKASNPRFWGTKVMFQKISSDSSKLCLGLRQKDVLADVSIKDLSTVEKNALESVSLKNLQINILNSLKSIIEQLNNEHSHRIVVNKKGLLLKRVNDINLFPSKQVVTRLLKDK